MFLRLECTVSVFTLRTMICMTLRTGIFNYHGNDHVIEYNKIHDAVKECLDMNAIYTRNEYVPQWRRAVL